MDEIKRYKAERDTESYKANVLSMANEKLLSRNKELVEKLDVAIARAEKEETIALELEKDCNQYHAALDLAVAERDRLDKECHEEARRRLDDGKKIANLTIERDEWKLEAERVSVFLRNVSERLDAAKACMDMLATERNEWKARAIEAEEELALYKSERPVLLEIAQLAHKYGSEEREGEDFIGPSPIATGQDLMWSLAHGYFHTKDEPELRNDIARYRIALAKDGK